MGVTGNTKMDLDVVHNLRKLIFSVCLIRELGVHR